jgi:hypothetical protein
VKRGPLTVSLEGRSEPSHSVATSGKLSHTGWSQGVRRKRDATVSDSVRPSETEMLGFMLGRAEPVNEHDQVVDRPPTLLPDNPPDPLQ